MRMAIRQLIPPESAPTRRDRANARAAPNGHLALALRNCACDPGPAIAGRARASRAASSAAPGTEPDLAMPNGDRAYGHNRHSHHPTPPAMPCHTRPQSIAGRWPAMIRSRRTLAIRCATLRKLSNLRALKTGMISQMGYHGFQLARRTRRQQAAGQGQPKRARAPARGRGLACGTAPAPSKRNCAKTQMAFTMQPGKQEREEAGHRA
jgi:hypothetical protein